MNTIMRSATFRTGFVVPLLLAFPLQSLVAQAVVPTPPTPIQTHRSASIACPQRELHFDSVAELQGQAGTVATRATVAGYTTAGDGGVGTFWRDDSDTTSSDNGGTIVVDVNGKRWKRLYSGPMDIKWFGCNPANTAAENDIAFGRVTALVSVGAAANFGNPTPTLLDLLFSDGEYSISSDTALLFDGPVNIYSTPGCRIQCQACHGIRIIAGAGTPIYNLHLDLPVIFQETIDWSSGKIGFLSQNVRNSQISVPHIYNFERGFVPQGDGHGWAYNEIFVGRLGNNRINLGFSEIDTLPTGSTGYVNENTWYGGKYEIRSGALDPFTHSVTFIDMPARDGITNNGPNRNVFIRPTMENVDGNVTKVNCGGNQNLFVSPRLEDAGSAPGSFVFTSLSRANAVDYCEISSGDPVFDDQGTGNVIRSFRNDVTGNSWDVNSASVLASNLRGNSRCAVAAKALGIGTDAAIGLCGDGSILWPAQFKRLSLNGDAVQISGGTRNGTSFNYHLMLAIAEASVPNGSLFVDSADSKLKFKDSVGGVHDLY